MTREQAKELLPIITAYAEGKEIEYNDAPKNHPPIWIECDGSFIATIEYRIKPEPKTVLMTVDDFPEGVIWIRRKEKPYAHLLILAIHTDTGSIWYSEEWSIYPHEFNEWEWSTDRKNWKPLTKVVSE